MLGGNMALLGEVTAEIIQKNERIKAKAGAGLQQLGASLVEQPKPKRRRKTLADMTPAEVEAFKQRKMMEEEARVLGKLVDVSKKQSRNCKPEAKTPVKKPVQAKQTKATKKVVKTKKPVEQVKKKPVCKSRSSKTPKMLQPLTPLYLLKIPGLPEGDCLAICYVKGAM
jgi:cell envelope opacity-associated protein A